MLRSSAMSPSSSVFTPSDGERIGGGLKKPSASAISFGSSARSRPGSRPRARSPLPALLMVSTFFPASVSTPSMISKPSVR